MLLDLTENDSTKPKLHFMPFCGSMRCLSGIFRKSPYLSLNYTSCGFIFRLLLIVILVIFDRNRVGTVKCRPFFLPRAVVSVRSCIFAPRLLPRRPILFAFALSVLGSAELTVVQPASPVSLADIADHQRNSPCSARERLRPLVSESFACACRAPRVDCERSGALTPLAASLSLRSRRPLCAALPCVHALRP